MMQLDLTFRSFIVATEWFSIGYFVVVNSVYAMLIFSAMEQVWRHSLRTRNEHLWRVLGSESSPTITVLVPAFNEEATILTSVRSFLALSYPNLEIVVVNDGSNDATLSILKEEFTLVEVHTAVRAEIRTAPIRGVFRSKSNPNLIVIDKENVGSRADAVNAALKQANGELVCAIDADTLIEPDALQRLVRPFLVDDLVAAASGTIRVVNGCTIDNGRVMKHRVTRNPVAGIQVVEYLRAFLFGRLGWNKLGGNLIVSGAFGLFRQSTMMHIGGYTAESIGEDMELTARIRSQDPGLDVPRKVVFIPDPVAWTEVPSSLKVLGGQRDRWHRGLADVVSRHRRLFFNPRRGALGMFVFPFFVLAELLSPVIELIGIVVTIAGSVTGILDVQSALLFLLAAYGYSMLLTLMTLLMDEIAYSRYESMTDRFLLLAWLVLENVGYRQLTLYWRIRGLYKFFRRQRSWGQMVRTGFETDPPRY